MSESVKTLKVRLKDKHAKILRAMANDVNTVWNYCNSISSKSIIERKKYFSAFDLHKLTAGFVNCEGVVISSATMQATCTEYVNKRNKARKVTLSTRHTSGSRVALGWVPFKVGNVKIKDNKIIFAGNRFSFWDSYNLTNYDLRSGCFSEDSSGKWYMCVVVRVQNKNSENLKAVGIDLGLKSVATTSDGDVLQGKWLHNLSGQIKEAQKTNNKERYASLHTKVVNKRNDDMHKFTTMLVNNYGTIVVGDVSSSRFTQTSFSKSVLDSSWFKFKTMLEYKCKIHGVSFKIVNESYTTQECSSCLSIPDSSPKGTTGLGVRCWTCSNCGVIHDRDVNAAINILRRGIVVRKRESLNE